MSCCKEKAVLVAVYEEKPRKRKSTRNNNVNVKHHHHYHHHHHHLHVHQPFIKDSGSAGNNRRAQLLSYSRHLRDSSKSLKASSTKSPQHPKSIVAASTTNTQQTTSTPPPAVHVQTKHQKLKKQYSRYWVDNMKKNIFKCFAVSHAKRSSVKKKTKKKNTDNSSAKKASVMMKKFTATTQKGARRFFKKLMATIQKYR